MTSPVNGGHSDNGTTVDISIHISEVANAFCAATDKIDHQRECHAYSAGRLIVGGSLLALYFAN